MALWVARKGNNVFTVHAKKPKWTKFDCQIDDCSQCDGFPDEIFELCYDEAIQYLPALKKLKDKEVAKFTVKIGG